MHPETAKKFGTGEAWAKFADEWFAFWRFIVITALFHAAAERTEHWALISLKWACYILVFRWTDYKINKLLWVLYPSSDPTKKRAKPTHVIVAILITSWIMIAVYVGTLFVIRAFIEAKGA